MPMAIIINHFIFHLTFYKTIWSMIKNTQQALNIANPTSFMKKARKYNTVLNSLNVPQIKNLAKMGLFDYRIIIRLK